MTWMLAMGLALFAAPAFAATYDVASDFSTTSNPNGVWSYGSSLELTSTLDPYAHCGNDRGIDIWSHFPTLNPPTVSHNGTADEILLSPEGIRYQPGQFALHPGGSGEYSHALWTAPAAGTYSISAEFMGLDQTGVSTDVHVLHNTSSLFTGTVTGYGVPTSFSTTVSVEAGDIIDFAVGIGTGHYWDDTTALAATISGGAWAQTPVERTGQVACHDAAGAVISCPGTGQDGDHQAGVRWPDPRFTDNGDGTVTDNLTGLVWLKDANCFGTRLWSQALSDSNALASGSCGLTDGSSAGDWRLPNIKEMKSLFHYGYHLPALPDTSGTGRWAEGDPFTNVQPSDDYYWSGSSVTGYTHFAWDVRMGYGDVNSHDKSTASYVWPVRGSSSLIAPVEKTEQTACHDSSGTVISCSGTGQDGDHRAGALWPTPRFTDNGDGTVSDNLTGLVWLKEANCFGSRLWAQALSDCSALTSGSCGLTDDSSAGDWRLPNIRELQSLFHYGYHLPALSDTSGAGKWTEGDPFTNVQTAGSFYWSGSSVTGYEHFAWDVRMDYGDTNSHGKSDSYFHVWPVRGTPFQLRLDDTDLLWTAETGAVDYDVVKGDLRALRESSGDFSIAVIECLEENIDATSTSHAGDPAIGEGFWYLVRGVSRDGNMTYDSGGPGQAGSRDAGIDADPDSCM